MAQPVDQAVAVVHAARTDGGKDSAKFILNVSDTVAFKVFALDSPYRLVIEMPEMDFEMDQGMEQVERGIVSNFRFGNLSGGRSRVVLDLAGPVKVNKAYTLPAIDDNSARMIVELEATSKDAFSKETLGNVIRVKANGKRQENRLVLLNEPEKQNSEEGEDNRPLVVS
ncbi:AMIN domain-containing protein [uncultured Cohaesibacter sp.]|uniref:AMIN domain-containing protein n=1 Tax=uncultured Cohaesibacter sp. TaxID=1002546 RepID=UPI00292FB786|nr:AMIN domain-containing protein [uncultured Cohaesibacter sp.]